MSEVRLAAEPRTEFGKGAARRTRRAGKVPAVLYGHGIDPVHVALPAHDFARVLREQGTNAVLSLELGSDATHLALTKTVTTHPLRNYIEHVDLLLVRRGEKVTVDVSVVVTGEAAPGSLVYQEMTTLTVEADAFAIPEELEVSVAGLEIGTQVLAGQVVLPEGVNLQADPGQLVVNVVAAPTAEDLEAEMDVEGAGVVEDAPEDEGVVEGGDTTETSGSADEGGSSERS
ncbi:MAG TPA: 50S ribosomal protein L25/general stress protein Ctc [Pseudonocardiaceae bacterium]|nr:50S ribosomal protein L25/general stress protein Ctc [Pseudonocardiaceae bacterium]